MSIKKVAVLGGGIGALTTAYELSNYEGWNEQYEITVYQMGWRLGGKCASGRNKKVGGRIEEHGLHIWFGFYENGFHLIRDAYDELIANQLAPGSPFLTWEDAFTGSGLCTMMEAVGLRWTPWSMTFPDLGGKPGENDLFDKPMPEKTAWEYAVRVIEFMAERFEEHLARHVAVPHFAIELPEFARDALSAAGLAVNEVLQIPLRIALDLAKSMDPNPANHTAGHYESLIHFLRSATDKLKVDAEDTLDATGDVRHLLKIIDVGSAMVIGMIRDGVIERGFEAVEEFDMVEWMEKHGSIYARDFLKPAYDGGFAYENGDPKRPSFSAASVLHIMFRALFTYRGAFYYKMNAGMGDTILSPLYLVLKNRGVKFKFFHRVTNLNLAPGGNTIDSVDIDIQASVHGGSGEYRPLIDEDGRPYERGLPCWPNEPLWDQIDSPGRSAQDFESYFPEVAAVEKVRLQRQKDFDIVVLGIPSGALPYICQSLIQSNERWRNMVENLKTVQTQALQLWFNQSAEAMGCQVPIFAGYLEPFDSYAGMSHLIPRERWPKDSAPKHIAYLCNSLSDDGTSPADPGAADLGLRRVQQYSLDFLRKSIRPVWPDAGSENDPERLNWDLLLAPDGVKDEARLQSQYFRANIEPTERYVLSIPGTAKFRLLASDTGFDNLCVAGDWTYNYLNCGMVEAAVISGRLAARSICGHPRFFFGVPVSDEELRAGASS